MGCCPIWLTLARIEWNYSQQLGSKCLPEVATRSYTPKTGQHARQRAITVAVALVVAMAEGRSDLQPLQQHSKRHIQMCYPPGKPSQQASCRHKGVNRLTVTAVCSAPSSSLRWAAVRDDASKASNAVLSRLTSMLQCHHHGLGCDTSMQPSLNADSSFRKY